MLRLLHSPCWDAPDGPSAVPATVPGALLLCLAAHGDGRGGWIDRETLVARFWPDRPPAEGQHNLRANLHRMRAMLAGWGCAEAMSAERTRLRLNLPTDLALLAEAVASADAAALLAHAPRQWLQGYRLPGFAEFRAWIDETGAHWQTAWQAACARSLERAPGDEPAEVRAALLCAWQDAGGAAAADGLSSVRGAAHAVGADRSLPGRSADQARLRSHVGPALVVLGDPGIGKTSLLTSTWPDAPLLKGRDGLGEVPYAPVLEWLRQHPGVLEAALRGPQAPLAAYRLDLARLLPEIARDEALPPLDAQTAKARLLEALARLFEAQGPVLLVDDLQWLDLATLEWLVLLAHRGQLPWRGSARRHELVGPARQACDSLQAARLLQFQALDGLADEALADACRARWPQRNWTPALLQGLQQASAGNPFVIGELLAQGADGAIVRGETVTLPRRVLELVGQRLRLQSAPVRAVVDAAAVLSSPATADLLTALCEGMGEAEVAEACDEAVASGLLSEQGTAVQCRHDLIRSAAIAGLGAARRRWLHRRAALALGAAGDADPLIVAGHWEQAQEPQTALAWVHRGAGQQKERGRFDEARALWERVAAESLDATQALRARLALAECELFHDLARGRDALQAVLDEAAAVADDIQRHQIEGQTLAGLIDNAVFSGELPRAVALAPRLRALLPQLPTAERVHACEVLIEMAMRQPDIEGAHALLAQVRRLAPHRPSTRSFEAQIHWFGGDPRAARDAFEALLAEHPDYCSGLTIENDLAVMLHALGELARAEDMARRSLQSWRGVPHTETLSLLVLGSVLTSAGRMAEARTVLDQALRLGREQSSRLFEGEALVRRARLWLACGRYAEAAADLDAADPMLHDSAEPLRVSAYTLACAQLATAVRGEIRTLDRVHLNVLLDRLRSISLNSTHPVMHARMAQVDALMALANGDAGRAEAAAARQADIARRAGLLEPLCDALLLQARAAQTAGRPEADWLISLREAADLAQTQGLADAAWRAHEMLARAQPDPAQRLAASQARLYLEAGSADSPFMASAARKREPRLDLGTD
jgi:tetratricopeptide (TPR) repeat protein